MDRRIRPTRPTHQTRAVDLAGRLALDPKERL